MKLFLRIFLVGLLVALIPLIVVAYISGEGVSEEVEGEARRSLESQVVLLGDLAQRAFAPGAEVSAAQARVRELARDTLRYTLIRGDGVVVADSANDPRAMENHGERAEVVGARAADFGYARRHSATTGVSTAYVAQRTVLHGEIVGFARAATPLKTLASRRERLLGWIKQAFWISLLISGLVALIEAQRMARRTEAMRVDAAAIVEGDYARRVQQPGNDELGDVGRSINAMAQHFEHQVDKIEGERRHLQAVLGAMVEGVIAVDGDERVLHCNAAAGNILRLDPRAAIGEPIWTVLRQAPISHALRDAMAGNRGHTQEVAISGAAGERLLRVQTTPLPRSGDDARDKGRAGAVVVLHDVTDLRRLASVRRDFVANASHELKTPVAAIRGLVETILDDDEMPAETTEQFLGRVLVQAERMQGLVEEMLALSRLEARGADVAGPEVVDLREPVRDAYEGVHPLAVERDVRLTLEVGDQAQPTRGNHEALRRIATNLVDNAVKYTPREGRVLIHLSGTEETVTLVVEDTGRGIPEDKRERVFERFYRIDDGRDRKAGGTGLGLAIVKHLVQSLGGSVHLSAPAEGSGSRFEVRFPRADASLLSP